MSRWLTLLEAAKQQGASDVFFSTGNPPMMRVHGLLCTFADATVFSSDEVAAGLNDMLSAQQRLHFSASADIDFAIEVSELGRFRVNAFQHHNGLGVVLRVLAQSPPALADLTAADAMAMSVLIDWADRVSGLVLFSGRSGCGKSSTQAALVERINSNGKRHVITVEDPIEYVHKSRGGLVHQREVGWHVQSFERALGAALRENPDVIVVGELRDTRSVQLALEAAETGHLVLATCHAGNAINSVSRLLEAVPAAQRSSARGLLAQSLIGIVFQCLLPTESGGRVAAFELLQATPAVRNLIREDKPMQILSAMQTGKTAGMRTIHQALEALADAGIVAKRCVADFARGY